MSVALGTEGASKLYLGEDEIDRLYMGSTQVWPREDIFNYDYILEGTYGEVDILYTADSHITWKGSGKSKYSEADQQMYNWSEVGGYKDKLWDAGRPAFLVDAGDFTNGGSSSTDSQKLYKQALEAFRNIGSKGYTKYILTTPGNHEWKFGDAAVTTTWISQLTNCSACNLLKSSDNTYHSWNKPYKAIKIGNHKIGIIGVCYPSPSSASYYDDSTQTSTYGGYKFLDACNNKSKQVNKQAAYSALYTKVQQYIDMFIDNDFDIIFAVTHMDTNTVESFESDTRFKARADFLLKNTHGLDFVVPGHRNYMTNRETMTDLNGRSCFVAPEASASIGSLGKIGLIFNDDNTITIKGKMLKKMSDLNNIDSWDY